MMLIPKRCIWAAVLLTSAFIYGCGASGTGTGAVAVLVEGTGIYSRPVSTESELAQQFFDQGLRLTWGYYFPEAAASHQEALRHDPDQAMIYWGLALALGPNPNSRRNGLQDDPQGEARKAINRAMQLIDNANEVERAFIETLHVRFDADAIPDRNARDQAYLAAARALFERYPEDPDAGTLLGDAYMITRPARSYWAADGQPLQGTAEAAAALERVMEVRPDHPGANHLYLHLLESSNMPEQALPAADRLEALMPGAGHVVHMPGHIYVRVGQHTRSIEQNERSIAADVAFLAAWGDLPFPQSGTYPLSAQNHRRHAYDFIRYSAAIQGSYAKAVAAAGDAIAHEPEERIRRGAADKTIAARWLVNKMFGRWDELLADERSMEGTLYLDGMWYYAQGSGQVGRDELGAAARSLSQLRAVAEDPDSQTIQRDSNSVAVLMELAAFGLEGEIMQAQGNLDGAIAAFESAVAIEDTLAYTEPPDWAQPMRHYLGAALLEAEDAVEAERVYRRDMTWNRNDGWALFGLWQSLEEQGKTEEAQAVYADFQDAWKEADVELSRSRF